MHSSRTLTFPLLSRCCSVQEHKRLKHIPLALASEQVLQEEAENCCRDGEEELGLTRLLAWGFADPQERDAFVTLLHLCSQRSSPTEQTLLHFAVFISTQLFYQPLVRHLPVSRPVNE